MTQLRRKLGELNVGSSERVVSALAGAALLALFEWRARSLVSRHPSLQPG
jgi:hypothetical protein